MFSVLMTLLAKKGGFRLFRYLVEYLHTKTIVQQLKIGGINALKEYENKLTNRAIVALWLVGIPTTVVAELFGFISIGALGVIIVGITTIMAAHAISQSVRVNGFVWKKSRYSVKTIISSLPNAILPKRKLFRGIYNFATAKSLREESGLKMPKLYLLTDKYGYNRIVKA